MLTLPTRARRRHDPDDWQRTDGGVWLPRVADAPLRGAGMVRRGMGFGFEPAGCCCGGEEFAPCTYCNLFGYEYDVTLSGLFNNIDGKGYTRPFGYNDVKGADAINGTHRLTWLQQRSPTVNYLCTSSTGGCQWLFYTTGVGIIVDYKADVPDEDDRFELSLHITPNQSLSLDVVLWLLVGVYGNEQYGWAATQIACEDGCLNGLELARCSGYYSDAFGLAADTAIIDAVP